jgi:hypothetical protein
MAISGVIPAGAVQIFPANAQNGLGSTTPPKRLGLPFWEKSEERTGKRTKLTSERRSRSI